MYELTGNEIIRERGSTMKDITQEYLKSLKKLFPIYGKKERQYIKNLQTPLQEYAEEKEDLSYEELTDAMAEIMVNDADVDTTLAELEAKGNELLSE